MRSIGRPHAVALDVVETLFSLDAVGEALGDAGIGAYAMDRFFARLVRNGAALAASGTFRPFVEVADAALASIAPSLNGTQRRDVLDRLGSLELHADVRPAFELLDGAGLPGLALTNGSTATTAALLERAELDPFVTGIVSIDDVAQMIVP